MDLTETAPEIPTHAGCVATITENGRIKILLITAKDKNNVWVLPKGRIEPGESPQKAALREMEEEAGVKGRITKSLGTVPRIKQSGEHILTEYFLVRVNKTNKKKYAGEGRLINWLPLSEAVVAATHEDTKTILAKL